MKDKSTFEIIEELSKRNKQDIQYALLKLMIKNKVDFIDLNIAYVKMLNQIRKDQLNLFHEAASCVLESFTYKKGNNTKYNTAHTNRCLYLLNKSNMFNMQEYNKKYQYKEELGKKMSVYERNKNKEQS